MGVLLRVEINGGIEEKMVKVVDVKDEEIKKILRRRRRRGGGGEMEEETGQLPFSFNTEPLLLISIL